MCGSLKAGGGYSLFPSQDEKKATVNVYWGHWEGPLFTLDTASGYTYTHTHTHTHHIWLLCAYHTT